VTITTGRPGRAVRDDLWALVARAKGGDSDAFGELYEQTRREVYVYLVSRVSNHHTAEDLTADTYVRAWRALARLERTNESPVGWLKTIAGRLSIDHHIRCRRRPELLAGEIYPRDAEGRLERAEHVHGDAAADPAHLAVDLGVVWEAAQDLTEGQRDALVGRYLLGLSIRDAGDWMGGRDYDSVRSLASRAVDALRRDPRVAALHPARHQVGA
jgi:RNA polymerase sigma-70 factor, ECF subfamily